MWPPERCVVSKTDAKWLPCPGLNPSASLPLQPHFWLRPQLATAASILGRCGPVVWSQLSPSSSGPYYKSLFGRPLLAAPCYKSLLSDIQPLYNHIKDNGQRSHLLITTFGWTWTSSYLSLGQGCPERGVQHGGSPSCKGKDLTESKSVGCHCEVAGSVSKGWHYWTVGILVIFWR